MTNNNRIFYAVHQAGFSLIGAEDYTAVHGLQSVGITTTFNLEQVFELGQIELYENIENIPDIEVTLEKVLDGHPLIYELATSGATSNTLSGRSNNQTDFSLSIFPDTYDAASGANAITQVYCSGVYVSALTYTFPVDGNCTESVTLVGNDKTWASGAAITFDGAFPVTLDDAPLATDGVQRRENVVMGAGAGASTFPTEIEGINSSGKNISNGSTFNAHIQTITVSTNLGREELFELGRRGPYYRFVSFPTEVTCSIDITSSQGDLVDAQADPAGGTNLTDQTIIIKTDDGTVVNLGTNNKLASVSYTGGDAAGGNVVTTYNYSNFNALTVTSP